MNEYVYCCILQKLQKLQKQKREREREKEKQNALLFSTNGLLYKSPFLDLDRIGSVYSSSYIPLYLLRKSRRTKRCLMVGRPCGQFQGASRPARLSTILYILFLSKVSPIMMEDLQALEANMALTLVGRICFLLMDWECCSISTIS